MTLNRTPCSPKSSHKIHKSKIFTQCDYVIGDTGDVMEPTYFFYHNSSQQFGMKIKV